MAIGMNDLQKDFVYTGQHPWWGVGQQVDQHMTPYEALKAVNGLFEVSANDTFYSKVETPIFTSNVTQFAKYGAEGAMILPVSSLSEEIKKLSEGKKYAIWAAGQMPGVYGTVRGDTEEFLGGVVSNRYHTIQNAEAIEFFKTFCDETEGVIETAGVLWGGKEVFLTAKLPGHISVGNNDMTNKYIVVVFNHNGKGSAKIIITPIRVVCNNTLRMALSSATDTIGIRHTKNASKRIQEVHRALKIQNQYWAELEGTLNAMTKISVSDQQFLQAFGLVYMQPEEVAQINKITPETIANFAGKKTGNFLGRLMEYREVGPGQDMFGGTAYHAYNAFTGQLCRESYGQKDEGQKRFKNLVYGRVNTNMQELGELFLHPATIETAWKEKQAKGKELLLAAN